MGKIIERIKNKLKNLSKRQKILIVVFSIVAIFSFLWWIFTLYIFKYFCITYLIPFLTQYTGIPNYTIEWFIFSLPLYFNIFTITLVVLLFIYIYLKKNTKEKH